MFYLRIFKLLNRHNFEISSKIGKEIYFKNYDFKFMKFFTLVRTFCNCKMGLLSLFTVNISYIF